MTRLPLAALLLAPAAMLPAPAAAQQFVLPEGCAGYLTVQMKGCMLSNYFRCEGDADGVQRHVTFLRDRMTGASVVDQEYQWLESYGTDKAERLGEAPDPASLTELFETGTDTYEFELIDESGPREARFRIVGIDQLEGGSVEIDGEPLERTRFAMKRINDVTGEEVVSVSGAQFVSEGRRLFFSGTETVEVNGRTIDLDHSPVRFIEPDEPGFFATEPLYGCSVSDTAFRP